MEVVMTSINPGYIAFVKSVLAGEASLEAVSEMVERGQELPVEESYVSLEAMCHLAIANEKWARLLRQHALKLYGAGAAAGNWEDWDLLRNYAKMAKDAEVIERLIFDVVQEECEPATAPSELLKQLGLEQYQVVGSSVRIRRVYGFRPFEE